MLTDTYTDTPESAVDLLGMDAKCKGIADFMKNCDTPMTISIQGDWGTGKTTTMQLIIKELKGEGQKNPICDIWFNTWQFSVLCDNSKLIIHLMSMMLRELSRRADKLLKGESGEKFKESNGRALASIAKLVGGNYVKALLKNLDYVGPVIDSAMESYSQLKDMTGTPSGSIPEQLQMQFKEAEHVVTLKNAIEEQIRLLTGEGKPFDRIYLFIDDLDRLEPIVAVELMEGIKNFIDCKGCVFVLAVDNEVVERGLQAKYGKEKYGDDFSPEKARKFFDKIIQVPFRLPVNTYDIAKYMAHFLANRDAQDMADRYAALLTDFDETNPRTIKRSFNLFRLQERIASYTPHAAVRSKESSLRQYALMLFRIESEECYDKVFVAIIKRHRTGSQDTDYSFQGISDDLHNLWDGKPMEDVKLNRINSLRIHAVLRVFFGDENGEFSDEELSNTKEFVSLIQELSPDDAQDNGSGTSLAKTFQRYYLFALNYKTRTVTMQCSTRVPQSVAEIAVLLQEHIFLSFKLMQNGQDLLMVKGNSMPNSNSVNVTLYTSEQPETLFGEQAAHFCKIQQGGPKPQPGQFVYYDRTGEQKARLTIIQDHDMDSNVIIGVIKRHLDAAIAP